VRITYGAMAPPLAKQLKGVLVSDFHLEHAQKDMEAIARLAIRGYLTTRQRDLMYEKLNNRIQREVIL